MYKVTTIKLKSDLSSERRLEGRKDKTIQKAERTYYIQKAERTELLTKNTISNKVKRNKDTPTSVKPERIFCWERSIHGNSEENLGWKEVTPDSNSNSHKETESL